MRSGLKILSDNPGKGLAIERQHVYRIKLKIWLNKGEPVRWKRVWGLIDRAVLEDNGETLITDLRIDRENLINGLFYGIEGMRIGGTRTLKISPHLAFGKRGIPDTIPENAVVIAEISFLEERQFATG
jgi:hypothetical protein